MRYTTESWVQKAKALNGGDYDYSKVQYITYKEKVCIICPKHGEFWQKPITHLDVPNVLGTIRTKFTRIR